MKLMKKTVAILALLGITGYTFGYDIGVSNGTDTPLVVQLKERALSAPTFKVIQPTSREVFSFGGAFCLDSIMVAPYDPSKANNLGSHALQRTEMYLVPKPLYEDTLKGTKAFAKGADDLGCKILEVAMKASPKSGATEDVRKVLDGLTPGGGSGGGSPADKEAAKKIDQLAADLKKELKTGTTWKTTPVPSAIDLLNKNKALLKAPDFKEVEDQLKKGKNEDAVLSLEMKALMLSISVDYDSNVYEGTNTYADVPTSTTKKEKCQWGFSKLAKASGTLAGLTLCKAREFLIITSGEKATKVINGKTYKLPYFEYAAESTVGE